MTTPYTVTATATIDNCTATNFLSVNVNVNDPDPGTLTVGGNLVVCQGESTTLTATTSGSAGDVTYEWDDGSTGASITVNPTVTTAYTVTATATQTLNDITCTATDNAVVSVTVNIPANNALTDTACKPYSWNNNIYTVSDTYYYNYTDANGCSCVDTLYLTYVDTTDIYITSSDFCESNNAVLEVKSDFTNFLWSTGETTSTITVYDEDTYTVTATQGSCSVERTYTIEPCEREILLPNAISPLSQYPENRIFCIPESDLGFIDDKYFSVDIYNRWGTLVFSSNSKHFQWGGCVKGDVFHGEIFNYIIRYRVKSGGMRKKEGSLLVL